MATTLQIHRPYVLKALSHPLDRPDGPGKHTVGEVFGQVSGPGSKKRKRSELAVAIDGDSLHLYDIPSAQAITSYLVPPQAYFTCAPHSLRWRCSTSKTASRYTYASTQDSLSAKKEIKLFKDVVAEAGNTTSTLATHMHHCAKPIVHISATSVRSSRDTLTNQDTPAHDLIAVSADGTLISLAGETLTEKWQSSPSILSQELPSNTGCHVDFVQPALAADVIDGMFGGKNELFGVFQEKIHRQGFNPDILVLVTSPEKSESTRQRHLHVLALPTERASQQVNQQNVIPIFAAPLPTKTGAAKFQLDVRSGTLQELSEGVLYTYAFNGGIPRLENKLEVPEMASFLRLSKTSVLAATADSLTVYNPVYRSLQATAPLEVEEGVSCELVTYLASREIAVGLRGTSLIAVQIEAPKTRTSKRRAEGLLADSIRRGLPRAQPAQKRGHVELPPSAILAEALPGTMTEEYLARLAADTAKADEYLNANNMKEFEELLAAQFKIQLKAKKEKKEKKDKKDKGNGTTQDKTETTSDLPEWSWPSKRSDYPQVDRRWVFYAISRVFAWTNPSENPKATHLSCRLAESSVLNYLVDAGHLTISNIKSAFKEEIRELGDQVDNVIGEELPAVLVEVDPAMELLVVFLSSTQTSPSELVTSIKLILSSLDLLNSATAPKLQELVLRPSPNASTTTSSEADKQPQDKDTEMTDDDAAITKQLDQAEQELQLTEYLATTSTRYPLRARGLSAAFSKLSACPSLPTVHTLRRLLTAEEIVCLMNVLRNEMIKDGWTTRYLADETSEEEGEQEAPPDGSIKLIADLLSRCIDAVGLGGWMGFDAILRSWGSQQDAAEFLEDFQNEVSVALEGLNETVRLQGMIGEATNYAKRANTWLHNAASKPKAVEGGEGTATTTTAVVQLSAGPLPLGLKTEEKIGLERVRGGGEIVQRSMRQIGMFVSKKRRGYEVHRISEEGLLSKGSGRPSLVVQEAL
ncbi:hypothetical protein QBC32DRAFT_361986 [Pseudoneurospora amorphoporcata]|uniref:Uncharacterized protein n=1 Tax=Pseudoneurospora amorphoporcata TaxID=241081 RepID=A0AAN6SGJ7_9PEZI|nr:hypothetical protein QBC32DRAFT_361986 [Pseudoneurospora amorphoporcata]